MRNIVDLTGKVIAITGAASGIGRESAKLAAELGARLALIDLSESGLNDTMAQIGGTGHVKCVADLSNRNDLLSVIQKVIDAFGPIDGLVHCAGISSRRPISLLKRESFDKIMEVNFFSFVELVKSFTKQGRMSDGGSIVVMSSISSVYGYKAKTEYCVSKAAVDAFVRCAALELAPRKIRVNSIMPAVVLTPMAQRASEINGSVGASSFDSPLGSSEPAEVANLIAFLLSDATQTMTGTSIRIDGGACVGGGVN